MQVFWKQGRCNRGNDCKFKLEGKPGKPSKATPARSNSNDSKGSDKSRRERRKSRGNSRSKTPKSPEGSPRSKAAAAPKPIDPYLVESTPAVLSVGMRCIDDGYDFVWMG